MAMDYASLADLQEHWPELPDVDIPKASQKLFEASVTVRGNYPDLDYRIATGVMGSDIPRLVVCQMVKRALEPKDMAGVDQMQQNAGPFGQTLTFTNPEGNIYLSKNERMLLRGGRVRKRAFTIHPGGA